jgi:cell wall-associated NlpC family hydrolase
MLGGCASTALRFRPPADDESRYAERIREEIRREDDRTVDVHRTTRRLRAQSTENEFLPRGMNRDRVLLDIVAFLGTPYRYGGMSREGIDCSGFTSRVYETGTGKALPRSARDQYQAGRGVDRGELRFGDLVFFNTTGWSASHVGIFIEDDLFAHASVTSGVTLSSLESTYYRNRFVGARRIIE